MDPARWPLVVGALLADHALITAAVVTPGSALIGGNLVRLPGSAPRVALTFDDGPDPDVTPAVLDLLDARRVRATFFVVGRRVAEHRGLGAEIHARGHAVENHTWGHPHAFGFYSRRAMEDEIRRAQDVIAEVTGRPPVCFRAPVGIRNPGLDPVLARLGLRLVSWSRRGFDGLSSDPRTVARRLLRRLAPGDIVLLHDGRSRAGRGRRTVLEVLPRLLDALGERGLATALLEP